MNADVRAAVLARANGNCECCGISLVTFGGQLDHFEGRKVAETVENCWMLSVDCHYQKTQNIPSAAWWAGRFLKHQRKHGYDTSKTASKLAYAEAKLALAVKP